MAIAPQWPRPGLNHSGFTLVELMISVVLGMSVVLAITGLVIAAKTAESTQIDSSNLQETATYALNNISRTVRQAGYTSYDLTESPLIDSENMTSSIIGLDASTLKAETTGIESPAKSTNHFSDVLAIRFAGSGIAHADNTVLNCAGFGVPAPESQSKAEVDRGWSIYYVANDSEGEPNLYCKYKGRQFNAQSIARGVESFQVLYGVDTSDPTNNTVNQFLTATDINALDAKIPALELNQKTHWKKIVAVKIALLIRSTENSTIRPENTGYDLFGMEYSLSKGVTDKGTRITESDIATTERRRLRKVFTTTIQLKNSIQ